MNKKVIKEHCVRCGLLKDEWKGRLCSVYGKSHGGHLANSETPKATTYQFHKKDFNKVGDSFVFSRKFMPEDEQELTATVVGLTGNFKVQDEPDNGIMLCQETILKLENGEYDVTYGCHSPIYTS